MRTGASVPTRRLGEPKSIKSSGDVCSMIRQISAENKDMLCAMFATSQTARARARVHRIACANICVHICTRVSGPTCARKCAHAQTHVRIGVSVLSNTFV